MQRLIFLDIDGVLAHYTSGERIDPVCVARLNRIVQATGAGVVISSSWRMQHTVTELRRVLEERGFEGTIVGATPALCGAPRGEEIRAYLASQPRGIRFVILDDVPDMDDEMRERLVLTDEFIGLQDADVEEAIGKLGR